MAATMTTQAYLSSRTIADLSHLAADDRVCGICYRGMIGMSSDQHSSSPSPARPSSPAGDRESPSPTPADLLLRAVSDAIERPQQTAMRARRTAAEGTAFTVHDSHIMCSDCLFRLVSEYHQNACPFCRRVLFVEPVVEPEDDDEDDDEIFEEEIPELDELDVAALGRALTRSISDWATLYETALVDEDHPNIAGASATISDIFLRRVDWSSHNPLRPVHQIDRHDYSPNVFARGDMPSPNTTRADHRQSRVALWRWFWTTFLSDNTDGWRNLSHHPAAADVVFTLLRAMRGWHIMAATPADLPGWCRSALRSCMELHSSLGPDFSAFVDDAIDAATQAFFTGSVRSLVSQAAPPLSTFVFEDHAWLDLLPDPPPPFHLAS